MAAGESSEAEEHLREALRLFPHLFGHVGMGLAWGRMAKAAHRAIGEGRGDRAFHEAKMATGRFYMSRVLPETQLRLARIETGAEPVMDLPAEAF